MSLTWSEGCAWRVTLPGKGDGVGQKCELGSVYVCVCVCLYVSLYVYVRVRVCVFIGVCELMSMYGFVCLCVYTVCVFLRALC